MQDKIPPQPNSSHVRVNETLEVPFCFQAIRSRNNSALGSNFSKLKLVDRLAVAIYKNLRPEESVLCKVLAAVKIGKKRGSLTFIADSNKVLASVSFMPARQPLRSTGDYTGQNNTMTSINEYYHF